MMKAKRGCMASQRRRLSAADRVHDGNSEILRPGSAGQCRISDGNPASLGLTLVGHQVRVLEKWTATQ